MVAIRKYKVVDGPDGHRGVYHSIPTADDDINQRITWGEPAVLTQVQFDKCCPLCGLSRADGFDLGLERGRVFGARCPREDGGCGWSF